MPRIDENVARWNEESSWSAGGEEWSGMWGGSEAQWWGALLPRIHAFVPAGTILEIGPGRGRWSQYLKGLCERLILLDLAPACIEACQARFAAEGHIDYQVGDGRSLAAITDRSVDFAFSFDSLVHAEADVLDSYARELARTLRPDGVGFIHHSNMGALRWQAAIARALPERLRRKLTVKGVVVNLYAWRAESPTAEGFAKSCERAGLACVGQETIAWEYGRQLTDVISTVTPRGSRWDRANVTVDNPRFAREARAIARGAKIYSPTSFPSAASRSSST
jgi:SAM-dependent methyltransferase